MKRNAPPPPYKQYYPQLFRVMQVFVRPFYTPVIFRKVCKPIIEHVFAYVNNYFQIFLLLKNMEKYGSIIYVHFGCVKGCVLDTLERIIFLKEQQYKSDAEFERAIGVSQHMYSKWINLRTKSYIKYINDIARALQTTTDYLLCQTTDPRLPTDKKNCDAAENTFTFAFTMSDGSKEIFEDVFRVEYLCSGKMHDGIPQRHKIENEELNSPTLDPPFDVCDFILFSTEHCLGRIREFRSLKITRQTHT